MDSLARRQGLDLDTPLPEQLNRLRVGTHLPVRPRAYDQPLRQLVEDLPEVGKDESVPVGPPPVGEHTLGQDDDVTRLLLTVDDEMTESVSLDPRSTHLPIIAPVWSLPRLWDGNLTATTSAARARPAGLLCGSRSTRRATPARQNDDLLRAILER
jgi:hypothetical protein